MGITWRRAARPALAGLGWLGLAGCAHLEPVAAWSDGAVAVRAAFGPAGRALAAVPEAATRIEVRVTGAGVPADAVLAATLTPDRARVTFTAVPAGPKRVVARAYGADARLLATGEAGLAIVPGATVAARLRLVPLDDGGRFDLVLE